MVFNWWQRIVDAVVFGWFPPLHGWRRKREEAYQELISLYAPQIRESLSTYQRMFALGELHNFKTGCGPGEYYRSEQAAWNEAYQLTREVTQKLQDKGYRFVYQSIKTPKELEEGWYAHSSVESGIYYWNSMEEFFSRRVGRTPAGVSSEWSPWTGVKGLYLFHRNKKEV